MSGLYSAHRLNEALLSLIHSCYTEVLDGAAAATFFRVLADLHARHGLSSILDSTWYRKPASSMTFREYAEHARARHGPVRAPLDAVLLAIGAEESLLGRARDSWHDWALGVQFYDDALDLEEDFRDQNLSWTVAHTLGYFDGCHSNPGSQGVPTSDEFYEKALVEGVISETLSHAESFFAESARLAEPIFPSWATYQKACINRVRLLREDYGKLITET